MELYKARQDGAISRKNINPNANTLEQLGNFVKKGELILVKNVESLTDKNLSFPYKKYTLWNGNYAVGIKQDGIDPYVKASFADVPEHLFIQIQKPKVYITLGVLLVGLATYSIIKERQNN